MMNITIISLGKLKEKYMTDYSAEYEKRLSAFCKLNIAELESVKLSDKPSQKEIESALEKETKLIESRIPNGAYLICMCIEGKKISSEVLAKKIEEIGTAGCSHICFVIGSSFGLSEGIKKKADFRLSMSDMTFPHKLARIMLLEQIYRAFSISNNGKYHK